jgi:hypothetical protein
LTTLKRCMLAAGVSAAALAAVPALASSHREAPFITEMPKVDGTDLYMFRSYEPGRSNYVTIIANYLPLQDAYGGPNYFKLDPDALYAINIDNDGDAVEDLTFRFKFSNVVRGLAVDAGGVSVPVALNNIGSVGNNGNRQDDDNLNVIERFRLSVVRNATGSPQSITNAQTGQDQFRKPSDYVGERSLPDYAEYARDQIYQIKIPGCSGRGRVFVGQRREGFAVNLGQIFDLINTSTDTEPSQPFVPVGEENRDVGPNSTADKNITTLALEVPIDCLTARGKGPIIGAWTTASLPRNRVLASTVGDDGPAQESGRFVQVSRLGMPLVNEVVIGLPDKDTFNNSRPSDDGQFATYVTNPTLPELIEILFGPSGVVAPLGLQAPNAFPRTDLVAVFLTGIDGLNQPPNVVASEMLRLNTSTPVTLKEDQSRLGVIDGDVAGFPNGRRPGDDVVDIALRVVMGKLLPLAQAPSGQLDFVDGAEVTSANFTNHFPYLRTPFPGNDPEVQ